MRKSPFSTPRGNRPNRGFSWNSSNHNHQRGYVSSRNDSTESSSSNFVQEPASTDFIPFNNSPQPSPRRQYSFPRGRRSFTGSPNFYNNTPSPRGQSNNFSPYKREGRGFYRSFTRSPRGEIPISQYVDLVSFLEDPWKDLVDQYNRAKIDDSLETSEPDHLDTDCQAANRISTVESPSFTHADPQSNLQVESS